MESYHGTSSSTASTIMSNPINVTLGGGELGRGFYSGQYLHEAKLWAYHKSGDRKNNVIKIDVPDDHIMTMHLKFLEQLEASQKRNNIRKTGQTRTFIFNVDMVWAPIVGTERITGDQYKWESPMAASLLNNPALTVKSII